MLRRSLRQRAASGLALLCCTAGAAVAQTADQRSPLDVTTYGVVLQEPAMATATVRRELRAGKVPFEVTTPHPPTRATPQSSPHPLRLMRVRCKRDRQAGRARAFHRRHCWIDLARTPQPVAVQLDRRPVHRRPFDDRLVQRRLVRGPVPVHLRHPVRAPGMERRLLGLRDFPHLPEHLGGGGLVEPDLAVHHPDRLAETRPDYILILPWNLQDEIVEQLAYARAWGARFVVPIPEPRVRT